MSYYPLILILEDAEIFPVLGKLSGPPHILDFSTTTRFVTTNYDSFQKGVFDQLAQQGKTWAIGKYLENRSSLLAQYPQMIENGRVFHAGLDVVAPPSTPVYAPIDGVVADVGFDEGLGNYGGFIRLEHVVDEIRFYSFYGHLRQPHILQKGQQVSAGSQVGALGTQADSGGWFSHLHLQILTQRAVDEGRVLEGYVDTKTLEEIEQLFPSPYFLFRQALNHQV